MPGSKKPSAAHLLLGPEEGEKNNFIDDLKKRIAAEDPAYETSTFYPYETEISNIVGMMRNGSLFASRKLVILRNVELIKRDDAALLGDYLKKPGTDVTLVLVSSGMEKDIAKAISSAVPKEFRKMFWELFENQKRSWLSTYFTRQQMEVVPEAMELILELVENNTRDMKTACDQLALFFGPGSCITVEEVDTFIFHSKEENVFTLFAKIGQHDFSGAVESLRKLLLSGEGNPIQLYAGLLWQFKRLLSLSSWTDVQYSPEEACSRAGIRGKRNQGNFIEANRNFTTEELKRIIVLIARFDALVRETRTDMHALLMELFLYYVIMKKGQMPEPYYSIGNGRRTRSA
jgi:DNA polymerase-3 subunit delta